jgi:hypothetical protein
LALTLERFASRYSNEAFAVLAELFDDSATWTNRIAETVELREDSIRRSVTVSLTIPSVSEGDDGVRQAIRAAPVIAPLLQTLGPWFEGTPEGLPVRTFLVPLMLAQRGVLLDDFDVKDESGLRVPVLSQDENKMVASLLIEAAFKVSIRSLTVKTDEDRLTVNHLREVLALVPELDPAASRQAYDMVFGESAIRGDDVFDHVRNDQTLERIVRFFAQSFLRIVEIQASEGDRTVLSYAYDSPWEAANRITPWDRWRTWVGQRPYSFRFPVPLAFRSRSYHFRMRAPRASYCNRAEFVAPGEEAHGGTRRYRQWTPPVGVQVKSEERGLPYAHLYVHGLAEEGPQPLFARVVFYERPPGSLGATLLFSTLGAATILVTAVAYQHVVLHADLFALLLAIPAAAALWLGPLFDTSDLVQAPLAARMGALSAGILAYGAALQVVIAGAFGLTGWISWTFMWVLWVLPSLYVVFYVGVRLRNGVRRSAVVRRAVETTAAAGG